MTPKKPSSGGDDPPTFGDWLQRECARRGADSFLAASKLLGVAHTSVRAWFLGHAEPSLDSQKKIADALGISYARVLIASGALDADDLQRDATLNEFSTADLLAELAKRTTD